MTKEKWEDEDLKAINKGLSDIEQGKIHSHEEVFGKEKWERIPMGVSQWKNHGIKFGYWDYHVTKNFISKDKLREWAEENQFPFDYAGPGVILVSDLLNLINKDE